MRINKLHRSILVLLLISSLGLAGCGGGSGPGLEIPSDPKAASQSELESLFGQISLQLQSAKPDSDKAEKLGAQLKTVGAELAERSGAAVRTRIAEAGRVDGMVPLGALQRELAGLDAIERWDSGVHAEIARDLDKELTRTKGAIADSEAKLAATSQDNVLDRLKLLAELSALSGTGSEDQARYAQERDDILRDVSKEAEVAIQNEDYEKAQDLLGIVQEVNPGDEVARQKKCEVDGKVILRRFAEALETGRVTQSVSMLKEFSETDCFAEIKDGLAESAAPMAEAFAMLGQEATTSNRLSIAYQRYKDSRTISTLLLDEESNLPGIEAFLKQVNQAYEKAFAAGQFGVAMGYLNVITEFSRMTPKVRQSIRITRDELRRRAVRGLTAYPFEDPKASPTKVGDAVASKVVQHIFQTIPSDVRIVEREQLERILDECKRSGTCEALDTADFIVQGTILDAKVETTEKTGSETRRVVTGSETITNPDHTRWAQLRDKERKNTTEPARTVTRDVTEDVTIRVTNVRKVGIISVSYRVVEASSGRVLFTDSIQTKQTFQDEGRQGVQLGSFKQETDFVELPPDIEILSGADGLSDKISLEIGIKLVAFLEDPEDQYATDAKRFVDEGDYFGAARNASYAIVLREIKSKELGNLREDLKTYAMESPAL
jgi:predicted small lipoprotein YifL